MTHLDTDLGRNTVNRRFQLALAAWMIGLIASVALHEVSSIDFVLQDHFFNQDQARWWVDADAPVPRFFFYLLPKWMTIATGVCLIGWMAVDRYQGVHKSTDGRTRWLMVVCLIALPVIAGLIKKYSGVWCPSELTRYGGEHEFRLLFASRPDGIEIGHCFPGGHASAGFAFLALYYTPFSRKRRIALLLGALALGWTMGIYQMLKGAHFLTHTLTTMCLAGVISLVVAHMLGIPPPFVTGASASARP